MHINSVFNLLGCSVSQIIIVIGGKEIRRDRSKADRNYVCVFQKEKKILNFIINTYLAHNIMSIRKSY